MNQSDHEKYMQIALSAAQVAAEAGEVPVGAIVVKDGVVIAEGKNQKESTFCPTHHAEILAIESASKHLRSWRLSDCDLYVTLEPCLMCAGAILQSRIRTVIFGTPDPKGGAVISLYKALEDPRQNHRCEVVPNILPKPCSEILTQFFQARRKSKYPS